VYFFVFHHSGLSSSRPLSLKTPKGFEDLVKHLVGMLSIREELGYHLDQTVSESQDQFYLNDRLYHVARLLFMRDSLRGRSTAVYHLKGIDPSSLNVTELGSCRSACSMYHRHPCRWYGISSTFNEEGSIPFR
jgi:hypothetical protein